MTPQELIAKLEAETARATAAEKQLEGWKVCNTCGGAPHPAGRECICGNTGSSVHELANLRIRAIKAEDRIAELEAELKNARHVQDLLYK